MPLSEHLRWIAGPPKRILISSGALSFFFFFFFLGSYLFSLCRCDVALKPRLVGLRRGSTSGALACRFRLSSDGMPRPVSTVSTNQKSRRCWAIRAMRKRRCGREKKKRKRKKNSETSRNHNLSVSCGICDSFLGHVSRLSWRLHLQPRWR